MGPEGGGFLQCGNVDASFWKMPLSLSSPFQGFLHVKSVTSPPELQVMAFGFLQVNTTSWL